MNPGELSRPAGAAGQRLYSNGLFFLKKKNTFIYINHGKMFLEHIYSCHHQQNLEQEAIWREGGRGWRCRWRVMAEARHRVHNSKLPVQMLCYQHIPQIARVSTRLVSRELMSGRLKYQIANSCPGRSGETMGRYDESCSSLSCKRGLARTDGEVEEQEGPELCRNLTFRQRAQIFDLHPIRFQPLCTANAHETPP